MKIRYVHKERVEIYFGSDELQQALAVLKALAQFFSATWISKVASDLEKDITQPKLKYTLYHHLCERCCTEVDTRTDNHLKVNEAWFHRTCPELKDKRP